MKTLKTRLAKKLANAYLLEGDDLYLFDKAVQMIKKTCDITMEDFNVVKFDDDNFSTEKFLDSTQVLPLIDEKKLIIVKNVTKISNSDLKLIANYLDNPVSSTVIIFYDFENKFGLLKDYAEFVDCKRFPSEMVQAILVSEAKKAGKKISQEALLTLLEFTNGYLTKAINELEKLVYYNTESELITKQMVDDCAIKDNEFVVFELTEALGKKNIDKAINLSQFLSKEQGILSLVTNHFRRMFFISISEENDLALAKELSIKEFAVKKLREQSKNFSKMQLKKIFSLLEEIDYNIKSGQMLSENAFNYLIFKILYI